MKLHDYDPGTRVVLYGRWVKEELEVSLYPSTITFPATVLLQQDGRTLVGWKINERRAGHAFGLYNEVRDLYLHGRSEEDFYLTLKKAEEEGFTHAVWASSQCSVHSASWPLARKVVEGQPPTPLVVVEPELCKRAYYGIECACSKCGGSHAGRS